MAPGARVLVVGAGGLGCPVALALAHAGAPLTIVDDDRVELSNLQRQVLHTTPDLGAPKVASIARSLAVLAPGADVRTIEERLDAGNAPRLLAGHAVVVDGTDTLATKFLINDLAVAAGVPLVHGGVMRFDGHVLVVAPGQPCYRCLFEGPPADDAPACGDAGVLGAMCGWVGGRMAERVLDVLAGRAHAHAGRLLVLDGRAGTEREVVFRSRPGCGACAAIPPRRASPELSERSVP